MLRLAIDRVVTFFFLIGWDGDGDRSMACKPMKGNGALLLYRVFVWMHAEKKVGRESSYIVHVPFRPLFYCDLLLGCTWVGQADDEDRFSGE